MSAKNCCSETLPRQRRLRFECPPGFVAITQGHSVAGAGPASGEGVAGGGGATLRKLRPIQVNLK